MDSIGGTLRYGIPEFRLPNSILDFYGNILAALGVKFRPNTKIGVNITAEDMFLDGYDAIFVATGTGRPNRLGLLGETLGHVHFAIDYLRSPAAYTLGKRVAIIGAGNVAIDAARTAIRKERARVTILHFMGEEDMTANSGEVEMAHIDGVEFFTSLPGGAYHRGCRDMRAGGKKTLPQTVRSASRRIFTPRFSCRPIRSSSPIGQGPGADMVSAGGVELSQRGLMQVDEFGRTSQPGVFAAGDVVSGPRTVVEAVACAKKTAQMIAQYCRSAR